MAKHLVGLLHTQTSSGPIMRISWRTFLVKHGERLTTIRILGYLNRAITLNGLVHSHICPHFSLTDRPSNSSDHFPWLVSGRKAAERTMETPPRAPWNQNSDCHVENVTITPPMKGPRAGPMRVPPRNQPRAVPRSVGRYTSLRQADPTTRKHVPANALMDRKMKNAGRLGDTAVARENTQNNTLDMTNI